MVKKGFRSITLPERLYEQLKKIVESDASYVTVSELVRAALREYLKNKGM